MAKSLGQHFLVSQKVINDIIDVGDIHADDVVLEIGPGKGILTEKLLLKAFKVIAVEKDSTLVSYLKEKFKTEIKEGKLVLIESDILQFNPKAYSLEPRAYKVVANIPYYITGAILKKFLSADPPAGGQPEQMVLLIQKEVAKRIVARDGKESILSISVKAYGNPRYIKKVSASYFKPPPKVDSAILSIENISKDFFGDISEQKFFRVLKTGFAHKRKLLANNIGILINADTKSRSTQIKKIFEKYNIPEKARAENIALKDWKCLIKELHNLQPTN